MNYEESMNGVNQIMQALLQANQPAPIEVDEMDKGQQQINDAFAEIAGGSSGVNQRGQAMLAAMNRNKKPKNQVSAADVGLQG